jgi:hypothetical protein
MVSKFPSHLVVKDCQKSYNTTSDFQEVVLYDFGNRGVNKHSHCERDQEMKMSVQM